MPNQNAIACHDLILKREFAKSSDRTLVGHSERVETLLQHFSTGQEMGDAVEIHSSLHTPVKDLEHKNLLMSTLTKVSD